jgi:hypothetical protein
MFSLRDLIYSQASEDPENDNFDDVDTNDVDSELPSLLTPFIDDELEGVVEGIRAPSRTFARRRTPVQTLEDDPIIKFFEDDLNRKDPAETNILEPPKSSILTAVPFHNYRRPRKQKEVLPSLYSSSPQVRIFC